MPIQWMPVYIRQAPKTFEAPVNSFMTCPSQDIHFLFRIVVSSRCLSPLLSIIIPSISHIIFTVIQMMINSCPCNFLWSSHSPAGNGLFTQTIHLVLMQTPISEHNPGPLNLSLYHLGLKGMGSWIQKSVPSTTNCNLASLTRICHHMSIHKMNHEIIGNKFVSLSYEQTTQQSNM